MNGNKIMHLVAKRIGNALTACKLYTGLTHAVYLCVLGKGLSTASFTVHWLNSSTVPTSAATCPQINGKHVRNVNVTRVTQSFQVPLITAQAM